MDIFHADRNAIVFVNIVNLISTSLPICSSHSVIRYYWLKEAQSVHFSAIAFDVTPQQYVVFAETVSYDHHILT